MPLGCAPKTVDRMKMLAFLSWAALALTALLFVADATLEDNGPVIVTSGRIGLPEPWRRDATERRSVLQLQTYDFVSQPLFDSQDRAETEPYAIESEARAARAEAHIQRKRNARIRKGDG